MRRADIHTTTLRVYLVWVPFLIISNDRFYTIHICTYNRTNNWRLCPRCLSNAIVGKIQQKSQQQREQ